MRVTFSLQDDWIIIESLNLFKEKNYLLNKGEIILYYK